MRTYSVFFSDGRTIHYRAESVGTVSRIATIEARIRGCSVVSIA
jgi:hypothetical protein